ncbi:odorant receptor 10-like [Arctopsyche grandis]|uniref:odorant receptor 10-like n=1 Tax=Arctopsyche grandis TaxID=121162 RepID=UPI00406DA0DF
MRPSMMSYFILCSLTLCTTLFQATLYGFSFRMFSMLEYVLAMMTQLLLFYWHSNEVIIEVEKLAFALYSCNWFDENKSFKTNLIILGEGLKLPIKFTVGPFQTMSLPTFVAILRASYSYFALLRQTQEKQKNH